MSTMQVFILITFCGLLGIFLRRNFLNIGVSLLQIAIGLNGLLSYFLSAQSESSFIMYLLFFLIFVFMIYMQAIAMLMIKRRSTLHINELTELRG